MSGDTYLCHIKNIVYLFWMNYVKKIQNLKSDIKQKNAKRENKLLNMANFWVLEKNILLREATCNF